MPPISVIVTKGTFLSSSYGDIIIEFQHLKPEISQYVQEMGAEWIVNGGIGSDWQAYLQTLENMRLPRLVEIYQTIYDRQLSE